MHTLTQQTFLHYVTAAVIIALISGCAANGRGMAQGDDDCSAARSAGAGALVGALLGAAIDGEKCALKIAESLNL